ncbi:family 43 glycosylhydrolase, partial [Patescibacteria group bacterium]|nr:family 43 glycosylhydrolase [Patescibacteria group bacterium]
MSLLKNLLISAPYTGFPSDAFRRSHEIAGVALAQTDYQTEITAFYKLLPDSDKWIWHDDCPILTVGAGGEWDDTSLAGGSVIKVGDTYYLYYSARTALGTSWAIGVATSPDGVNFTKYAGNPILQNAALDPEEDIYIWSPIVLYYEGVFYMYYTGRYTPNKECIRLATSSDGFTFTKQGTMLSPDDADAEAWENNWACHPDIPLWNGSQWVLLYCGGTLANEDVGRATSNSPSGPWTRD